MNKENYNRANKIRKQISELEGIASSLDPLTSAVDAIQVDNTSIRIHTFYNQKKVTEILIEGIKQEIQQLETQFDEM